jgi:lipoprotein-releasing system ATP-binding protein
MLLKLRNISKSYRNSYGRVLREVLNFADLSVDQGERIAITGPSGSGKTTLLNIAGTLDHPDEGEVYFRGEPVSGLHAGELAAIRNRDIGFIFQFHHLLPQLTLWENVMVPSIPLKSRKEEVSLRAEELLRETGLWEIRNQKPGELSGGECQRTAVVRALINNPLLVLADEPTGSLDSRNASKLTDMILRLTARNNSAVIIVTHSMEIAGQMDRICRLAEGKVVPGTIS